MMFLIASSIAHIAFCPPAVEGDIGDCELLSRGNADAPRCLGDGVSGASGISATG